MKLSKFLKVLFLINITLIISPINTKANIICNDGTTSKTCMDCHTGCCSRHGGCSSNPNNSSSSYSAASSYKAPVIKVKSSNNRIKTITIDGKGIAVKEKMSYITTNDEVTIKVNLESSLANADYNSTKYLDHGNNNEIITVTAEDGSKKIYYLDIKKISDNTNIKEIKINGSSISLYDMTYDSTDEDIELEVITEDENATVNYDKKIKLKEGKNEILITVIAENEEKKEYKLIIEYDASTGIIATLLALGGGGAAIGINYRKKKIKNS